MLAITVDTDWAPEELVQSTVELIKSYGCKVTVFCTNPIHIDVDEIAIHPNLTDLNDLRTPIRTLKEAFPQARGLRSHSLVFTERLRPIYREMGIQYDSNAICYLKPFIDCSIIAQGVSSIPIYFMDRFHLEMATDRTRMFSVEQFDLRSPGLKVFDFHPVHVFLNTTNVDMYEAAKPHYKDVENLKKHVAPGLGTRTLLLELLKFVSHNHIPTHTMSEIDAAFRPTLHRVRS